MRSRSTDVRVVVADCRDIRGLLSSVGRGPTKHMTKRKARELRGKWQLNRMGGEFREEATGGQYQLRDGTFQPVGGYGVLHEAPDALGRVVTMSSVGRQSQGDDTRIGGEPAFDHLGGVGRRAVEGQVEDAGWV